MMPIPKNGDGGRIASSVEFKFTHTMMLRSHATTPSQQKLKRAQKAVKSRINKIAVKTGIAMKRTTTVKKKQKAKKKTAQDEEDENPSKTQTPTSPTNSDAIWDGYWARYFMF